MESQTLLIVDEQAINLQQTITYLKSSGRLAEFIGEILRQYVIEQELQKREEVGIDPAIVEQAVVDFRLKNQLTEPRIFQEWLASNGMDFESFHNQVAFGFKLEKLKTQVIEPKLQEYFIERKIFLDQVVLSRIVVDNQELAEELCSQIDEGTGFEQLAREYSLTEDRIVNGMMGAISRGTLPDEIRAMVDRASPGEILGPVEFEERFSLLRVEQFLPASLDDNELEDALKNELFEQWLTEKIQKLNVKF